MIDINANVILTKIPAGRSLPDTLMNASGSVADRSRYGSTFFYDIRLNHEIDKINCVALVREDYLLVVNDQAEKKQAKEEEKARKNELHDQIEELKEELKAWPLPRKFDRESEMYTKVWQRRMKLHTKISELIKQVEDKV